MKDFHSEFECAKRLILEAQRTATTRFYSTPHITEKADKSYVTETDKELEFFFKTNFEKEYPEYGFIGEEGTLDIKEFNWIIDPIDGTTAFARGLSDFGLTLAFVSKHETIFALVYRPILNELFSAYTGEGTYRNDQRVSVSPISDIRHAVISFTPQCFSQEKYREYSLRLCQTNHLRITHSSAIESTLLSQGSIDVLIKFDQPIWDTAAQCLLMHEAGATIYDKFGQPLKLSYDNTSLHDYIATTPFLAENHKDVLYYLQ